MSGKRLLVNILISVVVIIAGFFLYSFLFPKDQAADEPGLESVDLLTGEPAEPTDEFLRVLLNLQSLSFETDVFELVRRGQFQDFSTPLVPKTPGRENPFLPIGKGGPPRAASSTRPAATTTNATAASTTSPRR